MERNTLKNSKINKNSFLFYIVYIILSILLCSFVINIDWFYFSSLKYELDTYTYERLLDSGGYDPTFLYGKSLLELLTSEFIWSMLLTYLNKFFTSNLIISILIPCIVIFSYSFYISKKSNYFYIMLLMHPICFMFYLNQLRLAFAFAIFYLIIIFFRSKLKFFLLPLLFFIHTSMVFFLFVFFAIEYIINLKTSEFKKIIYLMALGGISAYITGPLVSNILSFLGDRRADHYSTDEWQTSILTSLYCMLFILVICLNFIMVKSKKINFELSTSIVFFFMVAISPMLTGGYPFRFLSAVFPIVIVSFYYLNNIFKCLSIFTLLIIGFYMGLFQLNLVRYFGF